MHNPSGSKSKSFDSLSGAKSKESPLYASLYGTKVSLAKNLGLDSVPLVQHDNDKRVLRANGGKFPYAFLRVDSMRIDLDAQNVKQIKRSGSMIQAQQDDVLTIFKGYLFPATISLTLVFVTDDLIDALTYIEKLAILAATDTLSFEIKVPGSSSWMASIVFESNDFSIPASVLEDEENPKSMELSYPFVLKTKMGVIKPVSKINNEGRVDSSINVGVNDDAE